MSTPISLSCGIRRGGAGLTSFISQPSAFSLQVDLEAEKGMLKGAGPDAGETDGWFISRSSIP